MLKETFHLSPRQLEALKESEYFKSLGLEWPQLVNFVYRSVFETLTEEQYNAKYKEYKEGGGWRLNKLRLELDYILTLPPIMKHFMVKGDSMAFEGKLSIDNGDEVHCSLVLNDKLKDELFGLQDVYVFKIAGSTWIGRMKFYNPANDSITLTFYNPDKDNHPDIVISVEDITWAYKVIRVGKFRS